MQRSIYLKMADCYNAKSASSSDVERCVHSAASPQNAVQQIIQNEMNQLQNRIERCSMACQDELRDKYPKLTSISDGSNPAAEAMAKKCMIACGDKHIAMLKSIKYNLEQSIDEVTKR